MTRRLERIRKVLDRFMQTPPFQILLSYLVIQFVLVLLDTDEKYWWPIIFCIVTILAILVVHQQLEDSLFLSLKKVFVSKEMKINIEEISVSELRENATATIEFWGVYSNLLGIFGEIEVTPTVRIDPPLFKGNCSNLRGKPVWKGNPVPLIDMTSRGKESFHLEKYKGEIKLSFDNISEEYLRFTGEEEANLFLELYVGNFSEKDRIEIEPHYSLHLTTRINILNHLKILQYLIEKNYLKRLPPMYKPLCIRKEKGYYTNLCLVAEKLVLDREKALEREKALGEQGRVESKELFAIFNALTRLFYFSLKKMGHWGKTIKPYKPSEDIYDSGLNSQLPTLIWEKIQVLTKYESAVSDDVILSIFHTKEFEEEIRQNNARGVCLFGFGFKEDTCSIEAIFDMSDDSQRPNIWDELNTEDLSKMKEGSEKILGKYCDKLLKNQKKNNLSRKEIVGPAGNRLSTENILKLRPSEETKYLGKFLTSFPDLSSLWIDLSVCNREILDSGNKDLLRNIYADLIGRLILSHEILEQLIIVNLCVEGTNLSDGAFTALRDFSYESIPMYYPKHTESGWQFEDDKPIHHESRRSAILLSALDSHADEIRDLIRILEKTYKINPLFLISFISLDDPLSRTRQRFGVGINRISIFRIERGDYSLSLF